MEKFPFNPEEAARRVVDQAKEQYDNDKLKRFRSETLKQLEKKEKSNE